MQGRQAGKKVVVIKQLDEGTKERPYPHAIVAGIERYPRKVTRRMGTKKVQRRSRVKPFIKVSLPLNLMSPRRDQTLFPMKTVNYSHLFPTRYALELESLKGAVAAETFKEPTQRENTRKNIKKLLEERYQSGKNKWFFQPLRVSNTARTTVSMSDRFASSVLITSFISRCRGDDHKTTCTLHVLT